VLEGVGLITKASKNHIRWKASDPEEIYKIHERKQKLQRSQERESQLDQLISICKQELNLLSENQENWQYPFLPVKFLKQQKNLMAHVQNFPPNRHKIVGQLTLSSVREKRLKIVWFS
jgi:sugar-specific transcriptional regulator TrmB